MFSHNDYSAIQRLLGRIEGLLLSLQNEDMQTTAFDDFESLDCILDKYKPEENKNGN